MKNAIPLFDAGKIRVLTLDIEGRSFAYAARVGDRDPMEMTLDEWRAAPFLSAVVMLESIVDGAGGKAVAT